MLSLLLSLSLALQIIFVRINTDTHRASVGIILTPPLLRNKNTTPRKRSRNLFCVSAGGNCLSCKEQKRKKKKKTGRPQFSSFPIGWGLTENGPDTKWASWVTSLCCAALKKEEKNTGEPNKEENVRFSVLFCFFILRTRREGGKKHFVMSLFYTETTT